MLPVVPGQVDPRLERESGGGRGESERGREREKKRGGGKGRERLISLNMHQLWQC